MVMLSPLFELAKKVFKACANEADYETNSFDEHGKQRYVINIT